MVRARWVERAQSEKHARDRGPYGRPMPGMPCHHSLRSGGGKSRGSTELAFQSLFAGDSATQTTPVLPSWSAVTVSEGASLSSTTVPPAATAAAIRSDGHLGRHRDLDVETLTRGLVLVGVPEPQVR